MKLQKRTVDIVAAHEMVSEVEEGCKEEQKDIDEGFDKIFNHSVRMAEHVVQRSACHVLFEGSNIAAIRKYSRQRTITRRQWQYSS